MDGRENWVLHIPNHTRGYISAEKLFLIADISALQDAQNPQFHIFSKDLALPVSRFAFI